MHGPRTGGAAALVLGFLACGTLASAEDYSKWIGVYAGGGGGLYTGYTLSHIDPGPVLQGGVRFGWKRRIDIVAELRYGSFAATVLPDSFAPIEDSFPPDSVRVRSSFFSVRENVSSSSRERSRRSRRGMPK